MPTQDFGSKIGTSPSPVAEAAIKNSECVQMPKASVADALKTMTTNSEVKIPGK